MTAGNYLIQVRMTGFDASGRAELQETLGRIIEGAGSVRLSKVLDEVDQGKPLVVHQTNSATDADNIAGMLTRIGAKIEVVRTGPKKVR